MFVYDIDDPLPDTLGALLDVAADDFEAAMQDERYAFDPHRWHSQRPNAEEEGLCFICLAGSVIAKTLDASINADVYPKDYPDSIAVKLTALDCCMGGEFRHALELMNATVTSSYVREILEDAAHLLCYIDCSVEEFIMDLRDAASTIKKWEQDGYIIYNGGVK